MTVPPNLPPRAAAAARSPSTHLTGWDGMTAAMLSNVLLQDGRTALHWAAAEGHTAAVRDLLRKGADPVRTDLVSPPPPPPPPHTHTYQAATGTSSTP
jgi:hypothetical protein